MLMCCTSDVSLQFPTVYQHFCFVPLAFKFHWKVQCMFCIFCLSNIFNGLRILTWAWSNWCRSKFYFCNSLSSMLHLPCAKRYYWDTYCLWGIWIFLYRYMFLLELMVVLLSLPCYVCWFLIYVWHTTVADFHIISVEYFWKLMVW